MNQKTTIGLVMALLVGLAGVYWVESSGKQDVEKAAAGPKALFDPAPGEASEFEWVMTGAAPLKFVMQKDKWRMTAPITGSTEHFVVANDVTKIKDLKYSKAYLKNDPDRPTDEMAGLQSAQRVAKIVDKGGKAYVVKIGARQALSAKTYVQREGDDAIYLVDSDLNQDLKHGLADYRGKRVCEFDANTAQRLEASGENQYALVNSGAKWMLDAPMKARADSTAVTNVIRSLSQLSADKFVDDSPKTLRPFGLEHPRLVLSVATETKTPKPAPAPPASQPEVPEFDIVKSGYKVAFGGSADEKVFAMMQEPPSPVVFQIPEATFKQISAKLDDLRDKTVTDIEPARAQKIVVSSGSDSVELNKVGGQWQIMSGLAAGETAHAEFAAVDDLLKAVKGLKATGFEATESPAQGFAKPRAVIEVTCEGKMEPERLTVGDLTASKTGAYVRNDREGFIAVVAADATTALAVKPIEFLGRDLIRFNRELASQVDLIFPKYTVSVRKDTGAWKLVSPVQGASEQAAVSAILSDLSQLRGRRVVGRAQDAKTFSLDAPTVKVAVTVENPPRPKPPTSQPTTGPAAPPEMESVPPSRYTVSLTRIGDKAYAMALGGSVICEVDGKIVDDVLAELLDTKVTPIEASQARKLAYDGAEKFAFEKSGDTWSLAREPTFAVDPAKITEVFTSLNGLKAKEYTRYAGAKPADYGLAPAQISITAETDDLKAITLMISSSGPRGDEHYACLASSKDRIFVLKHEDVDKLAKKIKDFRKPG